MLLSICLVCAVAFSVATVLLLVGGHRSASASRTASIALGLVVAVVGGEAAGWIWRLPTVDVVLGEGLAVAAVTVSAVAAPRWNPFGHLFMGTYTVAAVAYLAFAAQLTVAGGLGPLGAVASVLLLVFEVGALALTWLFSFEACDVICRVAWPRRFRSDPGHRPFVSVHVPAYNEPPEMLIETIRSLERLDYPRFEIVVIDNNTKDPAVWQPVRDYCRDRQRVVFEHVAPWPGYKAGALNLALSGHTSDRAELIGVVDADYQVEPGWLSDVVGYFADPDLGFVQSPQDYREWAGDTYLTACYDALRYFFTISLRSRNLRDGAMFSGTMGLIRRSALEEVGGWDEWCITEDAEVSIRLLKAGYSGHLVDRSYGYGIMPLTFAALKRQRFRWAFGGMQTLRLHWSSLLPWDRDPANRMSVVQRLHHLAGNAGWFIDPVILGFATALYAIAASSLLFGRFEFRPLYGAAVLLPVALLVNGLMRGVWALTRANAISVRRGLLAFANLLSLSWTVTLACAGGLTRDEGTFLRTPKWEDDSGIRDALRQARPETALSVTLFGAGAVTTATVEGVGWFLAVIFAWQGLVYASSPLMSYLAVEAELTEELALRRRWYELRAALHAHRPVVVSTTVLLLAVGLGVLLAVTAPDSSEESDRLFQAPGQGPGRGPIGRLLPGPADTRSADGGQPASPGEPAPQDEPPAPGPAPDGGGGAGGPATPPAPRTAGPGQQATTRPGRERPGQADQEAPGGQAPTEPGERAPTEPAQQAPTEPGQQAATEPAQQAANEPAQQAATEPAQQAPAAPA